MAYCDSLNWGGHSDWMLPVREHMASIYTDTSVFPNFVENTPPLGIIAEMWTSSYYSSPNGVTYQRLVPYSYGQQYPTVVVEGHAQKFICIRNFDSAADEVNNSTNICLRNGGADNPCENGGACAGQMDSEYYFCICQDGYEGTNCESS